jgi:hypothetical protein
MVHFSSTLAVRVVSWELSRLLDSMLGLQAARNSELAETGAGAARMAGIRGAVVVRREVEVHGRRF